LAKSIFFVSWFDVGRTAVETGVMPSFKDLVLAGMGLLLGANILGFLYKWKDFRKTDHDYKIIGDQYCRVGSYIRAMEELKLIEKLDSESLMISACASAGLVQIPAAWKKAARAASLISNRKESPSPDLVFDLLITSCVLVQVPDNVIHELLHFGLRLGVGDVVMAIRMNQFISSNALNANEITRLSFLDRPTERPFCSTTYNVFMRQADLARQSMAHIQAKTQAEQLYYAELVLLILLTEGANNPSNRSKFFGEWSDKCLPFCSRLAPKSMDEVEVRLVLALLIDVAQVAEIVGDPYKQAWSYTRTSFSEANDRLSIVDSIADDIERITFDS
jgi:hypothetical protein